MKTLNHNEVLLISQNDDSFALITKKAWESHKNYVLNIFKEELSVSEAESELNSYIGDFTVKPVNQKDFGYYTNICKLEVNPSKKIKSYSGSLIFF